MALIREIERWNNSRSYGNRISEAAAKVRVTPPGKRLTDPRHRLLHDGELHLEGLQPSSYYVLLNEFITTLLLSMLD
jgi:hypothetical protein